MPASPALVLSLLLAAPAAPPASSVATYARDVGALAADDMEGRGLGTAGIRKAADYIEARLRALGLQPAFGKSWRQPLQVKTGVALGEGNALEGFQAEDWTPLAASSSGAFAGEVAFVGYGIQAPPIGYDELLGQDLKGKVVLMLRYEPQERDAASPFDGRRPSRWSALRYKLLKAREAGAAAVVFVTGPLQDEGKDKLPALKNDGPESPAGLPVLQLRLSAAQRLLGPAGLDLERFQKDVDHDLTPRSRALPGLRLSGRVNVRATYAETVNLAGLLPGKGALAQEVVVVGAHYDHLGWGGERSMKPNEHAVHNGADDNASGVAGVLLAAERAKALLAGSASHRTLACALFSGEEMGLAGSSAFVARPPFPMERVKAMLNLDMVGRLRDDKLVALGSESAAEWKPAVERLAAEVGLGVTASGDGYGPSDQTSFYAAKVPVLHFFTGTHDAYHTPDDDAAAINNEGGAKVAELTARLAAEIAGGGLTPAYARAVAAPAQGGDSRGYGAWLGTVPDYRAMSDTAGGGVLLGDVRPGSPAEKAGLKGGDTLVEMAGTRIENLYDMTYALQDHKPGDTVEVIVLRGGQRVTLRATLGSRGEQRAAATPAATPAPQAAPAPAPSAAPPTPAGPHAGAPGAAEPDPGKLFYAGRPGKDFVIGAGKPFDKSFEGEKHLADVRQLTFGGENAEAYFSPDGTKLIYQWTKPEGGCDQQYVLDLKTGDVKLVSTGKGRTTCGYYDWPEADRIVWASTEAGSPECPPVPDRSQGYVWPIFASYDLWEAAPDGSNPRRMTTTEGYDAEATWCHRGGKLVFTSMRDGDLDLYEMDEAGQVKRLTSTPGYDGGAFYSPDCSEIVYRALHPEGAPLEEYQRLLKQGLVRPSVMELWIMKADGSEQRQITQTGRANFGPYFHPDGQRIIYSSNAHAPTGREFDLFMIDKKGGTPEQITTAPGFDGFPMWSPDGNWLVWGSNRAELGGWQTNLFIARWVE